MKNKVKLVGVDTACVDHPLATSLGPHRNGPQIKYLLPEYKKATRRDAITDFPEWNAAHKVLLAAGIPTIENVGGDLDAAQRQALHLPGLPVEMARGRRLRHPPGGDARSQGQESAGAGALARARGQGANGAGQACKLYNLSHDWGHGMPQWPSRANLNVRVVEFHAKDGLLVQQFEGIMHRGTHMDAPIHVQREHADADRLSGVAVLRHRRRGLDSQGQMGRHHAEGS